MFPDNTPKEREYFITKAKGAVCIMQIGDKLENGEPHDGRAPDYDDWALNADILVYYPVLDIALELSSMGIRVDKEALLSQLEKAGCPERAAGGTIVAFHACCILAPVITDIRSIPALFGRLCLLLLFLFRLFFCLFLGFCFFLGLLGLLPSWHTSLRFLRLHTPYRSNHISACQGFPNNAAVRYRPDTDNW